MIQPGSICFIIRAEPGNEHYIGRVVTVISGLQPVAERGGTLMHEVDAPWLRIERPCRRFFAPPSGLRPIAGPEQTAPAPQESEPVPA